MKDDYSQKPLSSEPEEADSIDSPSAPADPSLSDSTPGQILEEMKMELERKTQAIQELKDKYLRVHAELENFKKRALKDQTDWVKYANEAILRDLLAVMDNLMRAKSHNPSATELAQWVTGVELTIKQFDETLAKFSVTPIKALGLPFDPTVHQAVLQVESDTEEGTVVDELQKGYLLHERVLRPAMVSVAKKNPVEKSSENNSEETSQNS